MKHFDFSTDPLYTEVQVAPALLYFQGLVRMAFGDRDPYHGLAHAMDVEKNVFMICDEPDIQVSNAEKLILRAAALLHDIGYAAYTPDWSKDRREHIRFGLDLVLLQLRNAPVFSDHLEWVDLVLYLIAYHDDTNYKYPSTVRGGRVTPVDLGEHAARIATFESALSNDDLLRLRLMLNILREADAMAATNTSGAQRTFNYSRERNLPLFSPGNPLNAWCWEESALGNVRIAAKRSLIDAISASGQRFARQHYTAVDTFIQELCAEHGVAYTPETDPIHLLSGAGLAIRQEEAALRVVRYQGWNALEATLRRVVLNGDRTLRPYASATIVPRRIPIADLRPAAYYALKGQIAGHQRVQTMLERDYALSLFDLMGVIDYAEDGDGARFRMAPPLVETYFEPSENAVVSVIVDGLHRVLLARNLGIQSIWAVEITDIPAHFPLVPLPLTWENVELCETVPPLHAKRKFRFPTLDDFPDLSKHSGVDIHEANYLYFFYRDLSLLGSDGIRGSR